MRRHAFYCKGVKDIKKLTFPPEVDPEVFPCKYCGKQCKTNRGRGVHEHWCVENPASKGSPLQPSDTDDTPLITFWTKATEEVESNMVKALVKAQPCQTTVEVHEHPTLPLNFCPCCGSNLTSYHPSKA